jgi:hypothetical protein
MLTNSAKFFIPDIDPGRPTPRGQVLEPTQLEFIPPTPDSGKYLDTISVRVRLTSEGEPLADRFIRISLGAQQQTARTNGEGEAQVDFALLDRPGLYQLRAMFTGAAEFEGVSVSQDFELMKQDTVLIGPASVTAQLDTDTGFVVGLHNLGQHPGPVLNKTIIFVVRGSNGNYVKRATTNYLGEAGICEVPLPPGNYVVDTYFGLTVPLAPPLNLEDRYYEGSSLLSVPLTILDTRRPRLTGLLEAVSSPGHVLDCGSYCPISVFRGGATISVKFQVRDENGNVVRLASPPVWLIPQRGNPITSNTPGIFPDPVSSGNTLRENGQHYSYNWNTRGLATGYYWRIGVMLEDGTIYYAIIILR